MAVYTEVTEQDLNRLLADFELGSLVTHKGIEGGIENTNYFVTLQGDDGGQQEYVLTLFEEFGMDEMPYFVELTGWLAERGCPVPAPFKDRDGIALKQLNGRPALLLPRFRGHHVAQQELTADHCAAAGKALAQLHKAGLDFYMRRQAHRGVFWWRRESQRVAQLLEADEAELLLREVRLFDELREAEPDLPMGAIHGDLFHDNALFDGTELTAILDVYNAATAYLMYDLAIVANDWCVNPDGTIDAGREQALLAAYAAERPFTDGERQAWPQLTRAAAMRFWLSRLIPWLGLEQAGRQSGEMKLKDPVELKRILQFRIDHTAPLP
ncbi:homoserine kinase [Marinobacterium nitratireducens]|uniref:Homoserine kinase n=1 Tax=Marinobacterium nitratireducens TaxID=518897 RepID=A0A918DNN5_9GAMM|nr:homoserine kinase [Marinobacterium nitratireducens]GGO77212.1 homoserine kinase [Marinobacterium nitratireducens]